MVQPLWKTVWRFLRKLKIELPYDPAIPLLGIYPGNTIPNVKWLAGGKQQHSTGRLALCFVMT